MAFPTLTDSMEIDPKASQNLDGRVAESALREELASFHEQKNRVIVHQCF